MDIPKVEMCCVVGEVASIHLHLVFVYVVCPHDSPTGLFKSHAHEADSGKKLCNRLLLAIHVNAFRNRPMVAGFRTVSSQILTTFQPFFWRAQVTTRSRATFREILRNQYGLFAFGIRHFRGCPCQKHPSTKTATLALGKTKSGLPSRA